MSTLETRTSLVTSAFGAAEAGGVEAAVAFARRYGEDAGVTLAIAVRDGRADAVAVAIEDAAAAAGVELEADIQLVVCTSEADVRRLVSRADAVLASGCEVLAAAADETGAPRLAAEADARSRVVVVGAPELAEELSRAGYDVPALEGEAIALRELRRLSPEALVSTDPQLALVALSVPGVRNVVLLADECVELVERVELARSLDCVVVGGEADRARLVQAGFGRERVVAGAGLPPVAETYLRRPLHAPERAEAPLDVVLVSTYMIDPPLCGGAMRMAELWGSMPAEVGATAFTLGSYRHPLRALRSFTDARPGREIQAALPPAAFTSTKLLDFAAGASCGDLAAALTVGPGDHFVEALALARTWEPDAVVVAHCFSTRQARAALPGVPLVYDCHNVEAALKAELYADTREGRELARAVGALEAETCLEAAVVITCTEDDRVALHERYGMPLERCGVVPNGVAVRRAAFVPWEERAAAVRPSCVFAGSDHGPNIRAVEEIAVVARLLPQVDFHVVGSVGRHVPPEAPPNLLRHGLVDEEVKQRIFASATLALNPMHGGSGSNLKVVDYAAAGLPVLTTPVGARGFSEELVASFAAYEGGAEELAEAVRLALETDWTERTATARAICEREYDWPVLARRYAEILRSGLA